MRRVQSGNTTYELQQHTRGVRNQSRAKTESSERNLPRGRGEWQRKTAELLTESRRKLRRLDGTVGDVGQRDDRSPEDADKMSGGGTVRKQGPNGRTELRSDAAGTHDNATCKLQQHPRDVRNQKDRDRGSEGNFAKSCEENRRRAPKIAGGANRGLEGSTERDSRLKRSLGDARPKGDRNPEEPEEGREIWPGPGEDVWDFGKDVRDPERPESFSGASLGNRKSQNTIRTSVRVSGDDNIGKTPERLEAEPEWNFRTDNPAKASLTGRYRVKAERQRKGSGTSRSDRINRKRRPEQIKGVRLSSLRLREEWKGGKGVVNDPDRSRSRDRAEDRRRPEISRVDGEVARADRSTEGQRPEVVRTEVGGRIGGEPELLKYGEASDQKGKEKENMRMRQKERWTIRTDKRKYTHSEDLGAADSADSAGLIGIGGGIVGDGVPNVSTNVRPAGLSSGTPSFILWRDSNQALRGLMWRTRNA
ncbi:hypothetical protein DFH06DRAFT_1150848 [Mycena polygramma]|nr:hypothetical protein DFH06DRAFT_1150848 [Mycena polygramma]